MGKNTNIEEKALPQWAACIEAYEPKDAREAEEKRMMLDLIRREGDRVLRRENAMAHMTVSSIIIDRERKHTLMAYHRIYNSWAWTGGHCDGMSDFEAVARKEAMEETGITELKRLGDAMASLEILPVWAHEKRGKAVGSHLHLNISYLFEADKEKGLRICEAENSAVGWLAIEEIEEKVSEEMMKPIYRKLLDRTNNC